LFFALSDEPWVLAGASVHISFVGQDDGSDTARALNGYQVLDINADLTTGLDLTQARTLSENLGVSFIGDTKGGDFEIDGATAQSMLAAPNPDGRSNRDVVRPWVNGADLNGRPRGMWIIDFGTNMPEREAALYEVPFECVRERVRPQRLAGRTTIAEWWLHERSRPVMRSALAGLSRYLGTTRLSPHRIFTWISTDVLPDSRLTVFAYEDDYPFGVLQSRVHEIWSRRTAGAQRREEVSGLTYGPTTCFETFPFPHPADAQRDAIADAARGLDRLRNGWLNPPGVSGADLAKRTLTNLYNARPTWLAQAHERLDAAVLAAYGWPADIDRDDLLARLLALNLARAEGEAAGN